MFKNETENFDPEIMAEMTIEPVNEHDIRAGEPRISEEDVDGLDKRDRKMVFHIAKLDQQNDKLITAFVDLVNQMRRGQANEIRERINRRKRDEEHDRENEARDAKSAELGFQARIIKWMAVAGGLAAIGEFFHWLGSKLLK